MLKHPVFAVYRPTDYHSYVNAEEAILGVICLTGDWFLAEVWLAQPRAKRICVDFQLYNYCDVIEEVLQRY